VTQGDMCCPSDGWFGVALTAFVTSTKLCYVEPG